MGDSRTPVDEVPRAPAATVIGESAEKVGSVIGPYKLMELIGEGGFGLVFVAEQQKPVRRRVAIKVIKPGMDSGCAHGSLGDPAKLYDALSHYVREEFDLPGDLFKKFVQTRGLRALYIPTRLLHLHQQINYFSQPLVDERIPFRAFVQQ